MLEGLNITACKCRGVPKDMRKCQCSRVPKDIHMQHYGKSGYRWFSYNKSSVACGVVDEEVLNVNKLGVEVKC